MAHQKQKKKKALAQAAKTVTAAPLPRLQPPVAGKRKLLLIAVLLITLVVYIPSLSNDFIVNWDDGGYIHEHELVHKLSFDNFITIFHPATFYKGNYHPLTTFSYALEYAAVGEKPLLYHIVNLIFHLLNVALVFVFIRLISGRVLAAALVALLFGIHPMHVESVAWISERKDVLYAFFFFLALIQYHYYYTQKDRKRKHYLLALLFFFLSLLSKSAAVALPLVMLVMDYFMKRRLNMKLILEKLPFFGLSLLFGIIAVLSQDEKGAIQDLTPMYGAFQRFLIVCDNIVVYMYKLFAPVQLAAMYPYPAADAKGMFPVMYYISPFIILVLAAVLVFTRKYGRSYIFGVLFFIASIILVLQIIPVGGASIAERYTYVPYTGLFFILAVLYDKGIGSNRQKLKKLKPLLHIIVAAFVIFCSVLTWQRIGKWKNGEVLFRDLARVFPNLPFTYNNLGYYYYHWFKNYDQAIVEFNTALGIDSSYYQAWANRGVVYNNTGNYVQAVSDFSKCLLLDPDNIDGLIGRANSLSAIGKFAEAMPDYNAYLKIKPDDGKAYLWRGTALYNMGSVDEAMNDFNRCRQLKPDDDEVDYWTALVLYKKGDYQASLPYFDKAVKYKPQKGEIYSWRGLARFNAGLTDDAIADYCQAISLNPSDAAAFVNRSIAYNKKGNLQQAWDDINTAGKMGYPLDKNYFLQLQSKIIAN